MWYDVSSGIVWSYVVPDADALRNLTILLDVTIGDNSMIGTGLVIARDITADVVAVDAPCKVSRPIGERDRGHCWNNRRLDVS
ncbi:hypothetical protein [Bifidobacterium angulatum]